MYEKMQEIVRRAYRSIEKPMFATGELMPRISIEPGTVPGEFNTVDVREVSDAEKPMFPTGSARELANRAMDESMRRNLAERKRVLDAEEGEASDAEQICGRIRSDMDEALKPLIERTMDVIAKRGMLKDEPSFDPWAESGQAADRAVGMYPMSGTEPKPLALSREPKHYTDFPARALRF